MSESPPAPPGANANEPAGPTAQPERPSFGRTVIDAILEGNSAVVTTLAIVVAVVIGGLLIAFTDPPVLHAWSTFFTTLRHALTHKAMLAGLLGNAISQAWNAAASAYSAMFEGAILNPHTLAAAFHGGSIS
ncbi:MAG TPA: hypothetical protein VKD26_11390, partial [Streptosporangiaceae bacterium]|nr:hypothetical protein [Streptosporangiaceae bacterium]